MTSRQTPPGLTSISEMVVLNPLGPHQCARCRGSVQASNTSSRGASNRRVKTSSRSAAPAVALLAAIVVLLVLLGFQFAQVFLQTVEALLPEVAIVLHPVGDVFERRRLQPAGSPLGFPRARDQARAFERLEVLGNGGHAHLEGLGQLRDGSLAGDQASQNRAAGRVGQGGEGGAEGVRRHLYLTI